MKEYTEQEKYDLAEKLDAVQGLLYAVTEFDVAESLIDALDDAIEYISPEYVEDCARELEDGMNSPEAKAFADSLLKTPEAQAFQAFIAEIDAMKNSIGGKIVDINSRKGRKDGGKN